ncbi:MAG: ABC transporter ATP-binding protein [Anaerolineae bacterium]|nr:ABC transporter ATP-binding protein [Anaerolineae bacterium]
MSDTLIQVDGLSYRYPDGTLALDDVSLRIQRRERVGLIGPNGAGKSTLLLHLNGVLRSDAGQIAIDGVTLSDRTLGQIRAQVGLVFQNPDDQLFSTLVEQDVAFGPLHMGLDEAEVMRRVEQALAAVGMSGAAERISYHLSGGEKKRIAIATVLSMQPKILVLDEPSSGLDPRTRRSLIHLLDSFTDQTLLISTHDMRLAYDLCSRVIILDEGKIAADGLASALLSDPILMERHGLESVGHG